MKWPFKWKAGESVRACVFAFSCVCGIVTEFGVLQSSVLLTKREWTDETWTEMKAEKNASPWLQYHWNIPYEMRRWTGALSTARVMRLTAALTERKKLHAKFRKTTTNDNEQSVHTGFVERTSERCAFLCLCLSHIASSSSFIFDDANWLRGKLNTTTGDASHRYHFDTHHQSESDRAAILFSPCCSCTLYTHVQSAFNVDSIWRQMCVRLVTRGRWSR